jgi:hypothetical protein
MTLRIDERYSILSISVSTVSSAVMLSVVIPSVTFSNCYAERHYAECRYTECHYAECRYAECRGTQQNSLAWGEKLLSSLSLAFGFPSRDALRFVKWVSYIKEEVNRTEPFLKRSSTVLSLPLQWEFPDPASVTWIVNAVNVGLYWKILSSGCCDGCQNWVCQKWG